MRIKKWLFRGTCLAAAVGMLTGCSVQELPGWLTGAGTDQTSQNSQDTAEASGGKSSVWEKGSQLREDDLTFDEFLHQLFLDSATSDTLTLHFFLADPEGYGITPGPVTIGNYGYEDRDQSREAVEECRKFLDRYREEGLSREQEISADILEAYLNSCEKDLELDYYYEPLKAGMGLQTGIPYSMAEYTFYKKQDVEDYLELLPQVDDYFLQVLDWEREKAEEGLFMTDELLDIVIEECRIYMWDGEEDFFLHETFVERLEDVPGLTQQERQDYMDREKKILTTEFYQAYETLAQELAILRGRGNNENGVCYFPRGQEYYEYLIESNIGMTFSGVDELYGRLSQEIQDIYDEIYALYEEDEGLWDQWGRKEKDRRSPDEMLEDLRNRISEDFPQAPESSYEVKKVSKSMEDYMNPAFYMIPPIDRYTDNVIYINEKQLEGNYNLYATLAHEGYPGHLYQNTYFWGKNDEEFRKMMNFTGYTEGWGMYAEHYSYQWMENITDMEQRLNSLTDRLDIVTSALLDVGINYYGWTRKDAVKICEAITGSGSEEVVDYLYPYIINDPAGYLDYYVGYLEIRGMEEEARQKLGNDFEIRQFHEFLLDFGPAPFTVIRPYFQEWMDSFSFEQKFPEIEYDPVVARESKERMEEKPGNAVRDVLPSGRLAVLPGLF